MMMMKQQEIYYPSNLNCRTFEGLLTILKHRVFNGYLFSNAYNYSFFFFFFIQITIGVWVSITRFVLCKIILNMKLQCVPEKRKPINRVNFSENCNDLSEKVYIVTKCILFLLTPVTRCIGHAWASTDHHMDTKCLIWQRPLSSVPYSAML